MVRDSLIAASAGRDIFPRVRRFFSERRKGYRAAIHVERYRSRAEQLRQDNPELFEQILAQADGSDAEDAARRDPVAYVALFLKAADDVEAGR